MNPSDCAHRKTPGNCPWGWCVNSKPRYRIVAMSKKEAEELMSYVDSSRYESETEIQKTERLIEELSSQVESLKSIRNDLVNRRNLDLLDKLGDRAVIRFTKKYGGGVTYHYAAIKSGKWWFVTSDGLECKRTSETLKMFIGDGTVEIMAPNKGL